MKLSKIVSALVCAATMSVAEEPKVYTTYLISQHYRDYMDMLAGRDPLEIEDVAAVAPTRMTAEPLIMQVAPVLGGCNCRVEYLPYEVDTPHARSIEQVRLGHMITHGVAGFIKDSRTDVAEIALSEPILSPDEFYVGLYTHEKRADILASKCESDVKKLRFAVGRNWEIDRAVLKERALNAVTADTWNNLILMIVHGRADVILQPFTSNDDLSFVDTVSDSKFIPIPECKMLFGDGRSYMVSLEHPDGPAFLEALNKGLGILREQGKLYDAMVYAGVINDTIDDFKDVPFD